MNNKASKLYMSDIVESEKNSPKYGDTQVLIAGETEKVQNYEKAGNQNKEYYNR